MSMQNYLGKTPILIGEQHNSTYGITCKFCTLNNCYYVLPDKITYQVQMNQEKA